MSRKKRKMIKVKRNGDILLYVIGDLVFSLFFYMVFIYYILRSTPAEDFWDFVGNVGETEGSFLFGLAILNLFMNVIVPGQIYNGYI